MEVYTDEEIDSLIHLVSQNPSLFCSKHANYKDQVFKDNTWKHIAEQMNRTNESCKKQWKTIRDGYIRFKRKRKPTESPVINSRVKWQIYSKLSFLDDVSPERQHTNIDSNATVQESESGLNTAKVFGELNNQNQEFCTNPLGEKRQKLSYSEDREILEYLQARDESRQLQLHELEKKVDEVNSFAKYAEDVLKTLPPVLQIKAKKDIFGVITKYELLAAEDNAASVEDNTDEKQFSEMNDYSSHSEVSEPEQKTVLMDLVKVEEDYE